MLRHSRAMTRHHRQRIINKREHIAWIRNLEDGGQLKRGMLSRHTPDSSRLCECPFCGPKIYKRLAPGQDKFMEEYRNE